MEKKYNISFTFIKYTTFLIIPFPIIKSLKMMNTFTRRMYSFNGYIHIQMGIRHTSGCLVRGPLLEHGFGQMMEAP